MIFCQVSDSHPPSKKKSPALSAGLLNHVKSRLN